MKSGLSILLDSVRRPSNEKVSVTIWTSQSERQEPLASMFATGLARTPIEGQIGLLRQDEGADMATLAVPIRSAEAWQDPNCVKVVCDATGRALYFSRSPIPFVRDGKANFAAEPPRFLQHLGIYAYRRPFLLSLASLPAEPLEEMEKLEQLRVLALGRSIQVGIVRQVSIGVDTREDYERFVATYRRKVGRAA